jgi:hypothetical protein
MSTNQSSVDIIATLIGNLYVDRTVRHLSYTRRFVSSILDHAFAIDDRYQKLISLLFEQIISKVEEDIIGDADYNRKLFKYLVSDFNIAKFLSLARSSLAYHDDDAVKIEFTLDLLFILRQNILDSKAEKVAELRNKLCHAIRSITNDPNISAVILQKAYAVIHCLPF